MTVLPSPFLSAYLGETHHHFTEASLYSSAERERNSLTPTNLHFDMMIPPFPSLIIIIIATTIITLTNCTVLLFV